MAFVPLGSFPFCAAQKKSTEINFKVLLGPEIARWGGGLPQKGVVVEEFVPSLGSLFSFVFVSTGDAWGGISRAPGGVHKVRAKKRLTMC